MSELSKAAYRRNGALNWMIGHINGIRRERIRADKVLTNIEKNDIDDAIELLEAVIDNRKRRWNRWKKKNAKKLKD